jgi:phosphotransferase system IIA component
MDDDYLAEHVLPLMNVPIYSTDIAIDELIDSTNNNTHHLSSLTEENGVEITLNATNEHVELTSKFFNNPQLSDIRLRVGTNIYYAHKFILAKSSDVLATLLYSQHWTSTEAEIQLEEQDECQGDVFEK